jgi:hypothetical protein
MPNDFNELGGSCSPWLEVDDALAIGEQIDV